MRRAGQLAGWLAGSASGTVGIWKRNSRCCGSLPSKIYLSLAELSLFVAFGILRDWGSVEGQWLGCKTLVLL